MNPTFHMTQDTEDGSERPMRHDEAGAWLHSVLTTKPTLRHCDALERLDDALGITPTLSHVGLLNNRDLLMRSPAWEQLSDADRAWLVWVDEADIPVITESVISAALAH